VTQNQRERNVILSTILIFFKKKKQEKLGPWAEGALYMLFYILSYLYILPYLAETFTKMKSI